jgi:ABC-2 type transport system ATP-binding protein
MNPQGPPLRVQGLTHRYGDVEALWDVSFEVPAGCLMALVGRNGAGKSTLLACAAGWTRASAGVIEVLGLPVGRAERQVRRFVALVPDTPRFWLDLTAWEHLHYLAGVHRIRDWRGEAEGLLAGFGLREHRDASPLAYSRGMRHKLALAMALMVRPRLVLLDEPFAPLDAESSSQLWGALRARSAAGAGVLFSVHQLPPGLEAVTPESILGALRSRG